MSSLEFEPNGGLPDAGAPAGVIGEVGARSIRMQALVGREVARFWKIKRQTLGAPILETFLYISVFGAALGSAIHLIHGYRYIVFVLPGLIMMSFATNAFANNSSSILQQKFTHAIDDQLSSPASPAELLVGFTLGGFIRGLLVSGISCTVAGIVAGEPIREPLVLIPSILLVGLFFANAGVLVGVRAQQFDDVALYQTFVLQPLIFLGGVFYSASTLPAPWGFLTHFDPLYYMISLVRYGFIGYHETSILISFIALFFATVALFCLNLWIFQKGRYLRT
jgi:ABC-2 type transport system permease protein